MDQNVLTKSPETSSAHVCFEKDKTDKIYISIGDGRVAEIEKVSTDLFVVTGEYKLSGEQLMFVSEVSSSHNVANPQCAAREYFDVPPYTFTKRVYK